MTVHRTGTPLICLSLAVVGMVLACEDVTVSPVAVASLDISPPQLTLTPGESRQLSIQLRDGNGNELPQRPLTWSTTDAAVAEVDGEGRVTAIAPGAADITVRSAGVDASTQVNVVEGASIVLEPQQVEFRAVEGGSDPESQVISVRNGGSGSLGGLSVSIEYQSGGEAGWLGADFSGTNAPAELTLNASVSGLQEGTYTATARISSPDAGSSPEVTVTMTVEEPEPEPDPEPLISLQPSSVTLDAVVDGSDPDEFTVSVTNAGDGTLSGLEASVRYVEGGSTGWLEVELAESTAPTELELEAEIDDLQVGTFVAVIEITSPVAANSPQEVSVTLNLTAPPSPPAAPSNLQASAQSANRINLSWSDNSDNEDEFEIERRRSGDEFDRVATVDEDAESYGDEGLQNGTTYHYRVRACNSEGCSGYSNVDDATTQGGTDEL